MPEPSESSAPVASTATYRRSLGTWLLVAFIGLALLPAITSLPAWFGSRAIQEPLERVASVVEAFGEHDRGFRRNVRNLYARLFVTRNFADRQSFEQTSVLIQRDLAAMRAHVEALDDSNLVPIEADHLGGQNRVEQYTRDYLGLVRLRFDYVDKRDEKVRVIHELAGSLADAGVGPEAVNLPDVVDQAVLASDSADIAAAQADFIAALDRLRARVSGAAGTERQSATSTIVNLADAGTGATGLFGLQAEIQELNERELVDRFALRDDVVSMINRLVEVDKANDDAASELLLTSAATLKSHNRSLVISVIASTIVALLVVIVFVRGNILRRLSALTETTRQLTGGSLDHPVTGEGSDELAELAEVLETFRLSALELRRSRRSLLERTKELEYANGELDQFAYVASHDLKAPLRAIANLVMFLREDIESGSGADAARHLSMIECRTQRLDALLDSLLAYSRAGRKNADCELVDLRELVESSASVVAPAGAALQFSGTFGQVSVCRAPLEQTVRNLVDNAFKHHDRQNGQVRIDCKVVDGNLRLVVADDGPGISPEHHDAVFGMFRTLQPRDKVEGSGMGLAILKKQIESYGGSITLESDPEARRGTTFTVIWPISEAAAADSEGAVVPEHRIAASAASGHFR